MSNADLIDSNVDRRDIPSLEKLLKARPHWAGNDLAINAIGLDPSVILHAGPPFKSVDDIPKPVLNSAAVALVYEDITKDFEDARSMILSGKIVMKPAQDYATVVPLAGVVSSSMYLHKIVDSNNPKNFAYAPFNGGNGPAMRLGMCNDKTLKHLRWVNRELSDAFDTILSNPLNHRDSIDLLDVAKEALANEDDCHGRTVAATRAVINRLKPTINHMEAIKEFLEDSPSFALNLLMAAAKCMLNAADYQPKSGVITAAGGNGIRTGIKVAGRPGEWLTSEANSPQGDLGKFPTSRALGAIGDSAVVDMIGFGAMAVGYSEPQRKAFGKYLPEDADQLPYTLLSSVHSEFGELEFRTGLSARTVVAKKTAPIVSLGIIDRKGRAGRLGGGIYRYPVSLFQDALEQIGS